MALQGLSVRNSALRPTQQPHITAFICRPQPGSAAGGWGQTAAEGSAITEQESSDLSNECLHQLCCKRRSIRQQLRPGALFSPQSFDAGPQGSNGHCGAERSGRFRSRADSSALSNTRRAAVIHKADPSAINGADRLSSVGFLCALFGNFISSTR